MNMFSILSTQQAFKRAVLIGKLFAGLVLDLANSEYQCLPTGKHSSSRGPNGNNFTIGQNIGILVAILFGLRFFAFFLLQAAYKLKKL